MDAQTRLFFQRHAENCLSGNFEDLEHLYEHSSLYVHSDGSESFVNHAELRTLWADHSTRYFAMGAVRVATDILEYHSFAPALTLVDVCGKFFSISDTKVAETLSTFVLRSEGTVQRIAVHIPQHDCGFHFGPHKLAL